LTISAPGNAESSMPQLYGRGGAASPWHTEKSTWRAGVDDAAWFAVAGVAKSMARGAVVLGVLPRLLDWGAQLPQAAVAGAEAGRLVGVFTERSSRSSLGRRGAELSHQFTVVFLTVLISLGIVHSTCPSLS
jgi:hypothetical protein